MIVNYDIYATMMFAREDLADLRSTRDTEELIDFLIEDAKNDKTLNDIHYYFGPEEFAELREVMREMILNPND